MILTRVAACLVGGIISIAAQAQSEAEPVLVNEIDQLWVEMFGGDLVPALTCDQVIELNDLEPICKTYASTNWCQEYFSTVELQSFRDSCRTFRLEQAERSIIFDNCVISKSRGIDSSAMGNVRSLCERISANPTALQRWRWGN
jgi:hypothetical protein